MRLIISAVTWDTLFRRGKGQIELVEKAKELACAGVELRPFWRAAGEEVPAVSRALAAADLICTYACNDPLFSDTPEKTLEWHGKMRQSLLLAETLGAKILRINAADAVFRPEYSGEEWWRDSLRSITADAAGRNITIAVENAPDLQKGSYRLYERIFSAVPDIKLTFDTANWLIAGQNPTEALKLFGRQTAYIHLKNALRTDDGFIHMPLYEGEVPVRQLAETFLADGYTGIMALEFPGGEEPEERVRRSMTYLGI